MVIVVWILNIVLALAFLLSGGMKLARPKAALAAQGMGYVEDYSSPFVKFIGAIEIVGALGLVLPLITRLAPVLAPLAAAGLTIVMIGAVVVHARRKESFTPALILAIASLASVVLGFIFIVG